MVKETEVADRREHVEEQKSALEHSRIPRDAKSSKRCVTSGLGGRRVGWECGSRQCRSQRGAVSGCLPDHGQKIPAVGRQNTKTNLQ